MIIPLGDGEAQFLRLLRPEERCGLPDYGELWLVTESTGTWLATPGPEWDGGDYDFPCLTWLREGETSEDALRRVLQVEHEMLLAGLQVSESN